MRPDQALRENEELRLALKTEQQRRQLAITALMSRAT